MCKIKKFLRDDWFVICGIAYICARVRTHARTRALTHTHTHTHTHAHKIIIFLIATVVLQKKKDIWTYMDLFRIYICLYIFICSPLNQVRAEVASMKEVNENKTILYYFAIVNELLIIKDYRISPAYCLMQTRDEMRPPCDRSC